ncbi:MAG: hypothetical protein SGCHY_002599 [Lobulomycetales sp.]
MFSRAASITASRRPIPAAPLAFRRGYHAKVIDHYENPRNVGSLNKANVNVGTGLVGAPACGDVMKLQIMVDDNGKIQDVAFKTFGCGSAIASSSFATEKIKGLHVWEAGQIKVCVGIIAANVQNTDIAKELALPPVKLHCSMLAEDAIKSAIKDWESKREGRSSLKQTSASPEDSASSA